MNQKLIVVSATYRPQRALTDNLSEACCLPKLYDAWVSNLSTYVLLPLLLLPLPSSPPPTLKPLARDSPADAAMPARFGTSRAPLMSAVWTLSSRSLL